MRSLEGFLLDYLLNSLWQVPLLFLAALLSTMLLRRHGSLLVHRVWVVTLVMEVLWPALSAKAAWLLSVFKLLTVGQNTTTHETVTVAFGPVAALNSIHLPPVLLHAIVLVYGTAVLLSLLRFLSAAHRTARLTRQAVPLSTTAATNALWKGTLHTFSIDRAELCASEQVRTPITVGLIRPRLVVPPGFLEQVSSEELHILFAHECAHMQRRDFGWNVLYEIASVPLAYHPLLRRTRDRIAESREWVCDELAVRATVGPATYARSLLRLASLLAQPALNVAPHAIGILDANALERRVMHLVSEHAKSTLLRRTLNLAASVAIGLTTCASAWALRTGVSLPGPQAAEVDKQSTRVPGGEMAGHIESRVNPVYPPEAKEARIQGSVVLRAVISRDGVIENLSVISGPKELAASAVEAVKQWVYKPYEINGEPVAVETTITVNYQLAN